MRAPKRKRPHRRRPARPRDGIDLAVLAERVVFVGSNEHKNYPSAAGPRALRGDATECDPALRDTRLFTEWVRTGIARGWVGAPWLGDFPRYVWHQVDDVWWEAYLVNSGLGQYKGWALAHDDPYPPEVA
jgi:hypothetical protein